MRRYHPEEADLGSVALVSYIPEPLCACLRELRRFFPGDHDPQPHVTILPPRPLRAAVEVASQEARRTLQQFPSFEVELARVRHFPETNMLYLDVGEGDSLLHGLHDALNTGNLAHVERFEFLPHLTLGGPVPAPSLTAIRQEVESCWRSTRCPARFSLTEIVCLWQRPGASWWDWQRIWSQSLGTGNNSKQAKAAGTAFTARTS